MALCQIMIKLKCRDCGEDVEKKTSCVAVCDPCQLRNRTEAKLRYTQEVIYKKRRERKANPILFWLNRHGGRDEHDLLVDENEKPYVLMYTPEGDEKVYVQG